MTRTGSFGSFEFTPSLVSSDNSAQDRRQQCNSQGCRHLPFFLSTKTNLSGVSSKNFRSPSHRSGLPVDASFNVVARNHLCYACYLFSLWRTWLYPAKHSISANSGGLITANG